MSGSVRIYVASKTRHAPMWKALRERGVPIISTWIDEAGPGETADLSELWTRCVREVENSTALLLYKEEADVLKGAWVELGVALSCDIRVSAVGIGNDVSVGKHPNVRHFSSVDEALKSRWLIS